MRAGGPPGEPVNRSVITILRGLASRSLRAGLVQLPEIHELSRAMLALDAVEQELIEREKKPDPPQVDKRPEE